MLLNVSIKSDVETVAQIYVLTNKRLHAYCKQFETECILFLINVCHRVISVNVERVLCVRTDAYGDM